MLLPISDALMLVLGFPLGFFSSGIFSPMGAFLAELFPTEIRGTAQGFAYNFGRAIGALFPSMIGYLSAKVGLGTAIGLFTVGAYTLLLLALLVLPETRGRSLADVRLGGGAKRGGDRCGGRSGDGKDEAVMAADDTGKTPLRLLPAGEAALLVELGDAIDPDLNEAVHRLDAAINRAAPDGLIETVPTYRSILVNFDPTRTTEAALADAISSLNAETREASAAPSGAAGSSRSASAASMAKT